MSLTESAVRNVRLALRQIRRRPAFAATVIVTLGLAIGATTAIFSFVNALLIRPFPFRDAGQLVEIRSVRGGQEGKLSMLEILDMQQQISKIESMAAHTGDAGGYNFSGDGGKPEEWKAILTTGNLFEVLGVPLAIGAPWPQPLDRTRDYRVILSYDVWQRRFGGRRDIVGQTISLDHSRDIRSTAWPRRRSTSPAASTCIGRLVASRTMTSGNRGVLLVLPESSARIPCRNCKPNST